MMKRALIYLLVLILVIILNGTINLKSTKIEIKRATNQSVANQEKDLRSVPNKILVKYKKQDKISIQSEVKALIESTYAIHEIKHFSFIDVYLYQILLDKNRTLEELNKNPNIESQN